MQGHREKRAQIHQAPERHYKVAEGGEPERDHREGPERHGRGQRSDSEHETTTPNEAVLDGLVT